MTTIYLAAPEGSTAMKGWDWDANPLSVLTSFHYAAGWRKMQSGPNPIRPLKVMLDSGAYSAFKLGVQIDFDAFCETARSPEWDEVVVLDVIGDAEASMRNAERMRSMGLGNAIPVFHLGDPWEHLDHYCAHWPKVGLSRTGTKSLNTVIRWLTKCFERQWPHRFHSFGFVNVNVMVRFPFHSADATTWSQASIHRNIIMGGQYGKRGQQPLRGLPPDAIENLTRINIVAQARLERQLQALWGKELAAIATTP